MSYRRHTSLTLRGMKPVRTTFMGGELPKGDEVFFDLCELECPAERNHLILFSGQQESIRFQNG